MAAAKNVLIQALTEEELTIATKNRTSDAEAELQEETHLGYVEQIGSTTNNVTQYFAFFSANASSVHTAQSSIGVPSVTLSEANRRNHTARRATETA
ncbi:hypothetical protein DAPPUDRAFT_330726 [Daphnia pulex]|uniref:Uncharacterized protein n=1 Tax=Daphnia pulex TaxID=6669 RepID=E9HKG0_DAPPU|nr:hypothetical protein DAPPUDRAFT_330726 [Daphnia pulex]|eukprot:EFX67780.1 hypothetical protein DAPPUDRAFT_330726 [Daphnia pulex]